MNNINLEIENLVFSIRKNIEESNLPIGIVYYIFKDIFSSLEKQYYTSLNTLLLKQKKSQQQQENQEKSSSQGQAN